MQHRRKLASQIGAIGAPLLVVLAARVLLAPVPGASAASSLTTVVATNVPAGGASAVPLSPAQQRAVQWANEVVWGGLHSPLCRLPEAPAPTVPTPTVRTPEVAPRPALPPPSREDPTLGLRLTAIMGGADTGMVLINGKLYRAGDEVKPGLRLRDVDARNNRVTLADDRGEYVIGREE